MMNLRSSALEAAVEPLSPVWGEAHGMRVPLHYSDSESELSQVETLAIADLSLLPKFGVKGPGAEAFLKREGVSTPTEVYGIDSIAGGGWVVRVDRDEFFLEEALAGNKVESLDAALGVGGAGVYRVEHQETGLLLCGINAVQVFRQTCGYPFEIEPGIGQEDQPIRSTEYVLTRVALATCAILRYTWNGIPAYRIWCVPSSGRYLWETLLEICNDLGGKPVGLSCYRNTFGKDVA